MLTERLLADATLDETPARDFPKPILMILAAALGLMTLNKRANRAAHRPLRRSVSDYFEGVLQA